MSDRPYEFTRWEAPRDPDQAFLTRMLSREGLSSELKEMEADARTPEIKFARPVVCALVSGHLQFAFPGYGVIELLPGDLLEIEPDVLHDITVLSGKPAAYLLALR